MTRPVVIVAAVVLVLFGAITWFKHRPREEGTGPAARPATAQDGRVREFWDAYRRASDSRVAGDVSSAAESYTRALALNPEHEDALYYLGNMYLELGRYREAETTWERLVQVNPRSSRAHSRLGDLHFCLEPGAPVDVTRAEAEFRRALDINREETGPLLRLGEIALVRGDFDEARYYLDAVIGANSGSVDAHVLRGYVAWREGEVPQAAARYARAVELARPPEPPAGASNEGDTKHGVAPLIAPQMKCRAFQPEMVPVSAPEGADLTAQMQRQYRRLTQVIEEFRRFRS